MLIKPFNFVLVPDLVDADQISSHMTAAGAQHWVAERTAKKLNEIYCLEDGHEITANALTIEPANCTYHSRHLSSTTLTPYLEFSYFGNPDLGHRPRK